MTTIGKSTETTRELPVDLTILPSEKQDDIDADVEAGRPPATMPDPGNAPGGK